MKTPNSRRSLVAAYVLTCTLSPMITHAELVYEFDSGDINDEWLVHQRENWPRLVEITQENGQAVVTATGIGTIGGMASIASFDPVTDGINVTFVVTEVVGAPYENGFFVGVVDDNTVLHRNTNNFGIAMFGVEPITFSLARSSPSH